jgi:signal transduction histidine kinase
MEPQKDDQSSGEDVVTIRRLGSNPDYAGGDTHQRVRLSFRAKLGLTSLITVFPILAYVIFGNNQVWLGLLFGLLSFFLGAALNWWVTRPLSMISKRARSLAGTYQEDRPLFGLLSTSPPWDETISAALDEIEESLWEIQSLNRIGQLIASDLKQEQVLGGIVEEAVTLLKADAGLIGLWDSDKKIFLDVAACNMPIAFPGREFGVQDSFSSQVADSGRVIFIDDYSKYPYRIPEIEQFQFKATLGAPLSVKGESRGSIVILSNNPNRRFTSRDGQLLETFAVQAGAALEKVNLFEIAVKQLDELTRAQEELAAEGFELERALLNIVEVQETERARIAADIHDGVVQSMVGSLYELQAVMAQKSKLPEGIQKKIDGVRALIQETIVELRRVIFNLRPLTLDLTGLAPAVEQLVQECAQVASFRPNVHIIGNPVRFAKQSETAAYRIIQESLNNAFKHANASKVDVSVIFSSDFVDISVVDNGRGFIFKDISTPEVRSAGIIGMRERARSVGGHVQIISSTQHGTEVLAHIPKAFTKSEGAAVAEKSLDQFC